VPRHQHTNMCTQSCPGCCHLRPAGHGISIEQAPDTSCAMAGCYNKGVCLCCHDPGCCQVMFPAPMNASEDNIASAASKLMIGQGRCSSSSSRKQHGNSSPNQQQLQAGSAVQ
jgi:hypothetical protein